MRGQTRYSWEGSLGSMAALLVKGEEEAGEALVVVGPREEDAEDTSQVATQEVTASVLLQLELAAAAAMVVRAAMAATVAMPKVKGKTLKTYRKFPLF
jgi:hypothetical protein